MLNCAAVVQGALHTLNSPLALANTGLQGDSLAPSVQGSLHTASPADTGLQGDLLLSVQHEEPYKAYIGYILVIF